MAKLNTLFQIPKWGSPRQKEIEGRYFAKGIDFEPVIYTAHEKTLGNSTPVSHRGRGFMSSTMNGNLLGTMKELYPEHMKVDNHGRDYFLLDQQTRVYFKKLDASYCPLNIPTNHVRQLNSMELLLKDNPITVLYAGFRLKEDKIWDALQGCYLVEMRDMQKPNWVSDLSDLGLQMGQSETPVNPLITGDMSGEITVKPKTKGNSEFGNTAEGAG